MMDIVPERSIKTQRVSELQSASALSGNEELLIKQGADIKRAAVSDVVDLIDATLNNRLNTSCLVVDSNTPGYSLDGQGRVKFQNDILKGKTGYIVEPRQMGGIKFSPKQNIDISYNAGAGSFTVLVPGFVLQAGYELFVWVNLAKDTGSGEGGGDTGAIEAQLENHETRIEALENGGSGVNITNLVVVADNQTQFNISTAPTSKSWITINGMAFYPTDDYTISLVGSNMTLTWVGSFPLETTDIIKLFKD
jgi:hypothetical protein